MLSGVRFIPKQKSIDRCAQNEIPKPAELQISVVASEESQNERQCETSSKTNSSAARHLRELLKKGSNVSTTNIMGGDHTSTTDYEVASMKQLQSRKRVAELNAKLKAEGSDISVAEMVALEKLDRQSDHPKKHRLSVYDEAFASAILDKSQRKASDADSDNDERIDTQNIKRSKFAEVQMDHKRKSKSRCVFCCFDKNSTLFETQHWTVAMKPEAIKLCEYHCIVFPKNHINATLVADDSAFAELLSIKTSLARMFDNMGRRTLYVESAVDYESNLHAVIDILPITSGQLAESISSFRLGIQTYDEQQSTDLKRIFYLSPKKSLRNVVPRNMEFCSIDWTVETLVSDALATGMVHVFEEGLSSQQQFGSSASDFGLDIIGSAIFDSDPQRTREIAGGKDLRIDESELNRLKNAWKSVAET